MSQEKWIVLEVTAVYMQLEVIAILLSIVNRNITKWFYKTYEKRAELHIFIKIHV